MTATYGDYQQIVRDTYSPMLMGVLSQSVSKITPFLSKIPGTIDGQRYHIDFGGHVIARETTGDRSPKYEPQAATYARRSVSLRTIDASVELPDFDMEQAARSKELPKSYWMERIIAALQIKADRLAIESMFASVMSGPTGGTALSFASDGGTTIDATGGITWEILMNIQRSIANNMGEKQLIFGCTPDENIALQAQLEVMSSDYLTSRDTAFDGPLLSRAGGINFLNFPANGPVLGFSSEPPILPVSGGVRTNFVMMAESMTASPIQIDNVFIGPPSDLHYKSVVLGAAASLAFLRLEGKHIIKVTTTPVT